MGKTSLRIRYFSRVLLEPVRGVPVKGQRILELLNGSIHKAQGYSLLKNEAKRCRTGTPRASTYTLDAQFFEELDIAPKGGVTPHEVSTLAGALGVHVAHVPIYNAVKSLTSVNKIANTIRSFIVAKLGFDAPEAVLAFIENNRQMCDAIRKALGQAVTAGATPPTIARNSGLIRMHATRSIPSREGLKSYFMDCGAGGFRSRWEGALSGMDIDAEDPRIPAAVAAVLLSYIEENEPGTVFPPPKKYADDANREILEELKKLLYFSTDGTAKQLYCLKNTETKEVYLVEDWNNFYTTHSLPGTPLNNGIYYTDEFWEKRKVSKDVGIVNPGVFDPKMFGKYCETTFPRYCSENKGDTPRLYSNSSEEYCLHYRDLDELQISSSDDISAWEEFCVRLKDPAAFKTWVWRLFDADDVGRQALYLRGHGADGKSQVAKVLAEALGRDMATAWDGSGKNNFPYEDLTGKRLIVVAEKTAMWEIFTNSVFKVITGGDRQQIQRKGRRAATYDFTGSKVLIITNDFPFATDDNPTLTRIVYVEMEKRGCSKESTEWPKLLKEQLPAFLRHCKCIASSPDSLDEDGNIKQRMPLSALASTPRLLLRDCCADLIMNRGFAINTAGIHAIMAEALGSGARKSELYPLLAAKVITGNATIEPRQVASVFSREDLRAMSIAVANELKLRGCVEVMGNYVPPTVEALRLKTMEESGNTAPAPQEEEINFDAMVSAAMVEELTLD
jgi:hypothetical protein